MCAKSYQVVTARLPEITDIAGTEGKTGLHILPGSVKDPYRAMLPARENAE